MRTLFLACIQVALLCGLATTGFSQTRILPPPPPAAEQSAIEAAFRQLITAANNRSVEGVKAVTLPSFDARGDGLWFVQSGFHQFSKREDLHGAEVATLLRLTRLLTGDVAFGDGFFRTVGWPGAELAGEVSVSLVKRDGKWLVATVRFDPYRFSDAVFLPVKPALTEATPGQDGWVTLFDGTSMDAFEGPAGDPVPPGWTIEGGLLKLAPVKRPLRGIRTKDTFTSFELQFDWKVPPKGNSGVKYRLFYFWAGDATGHEYQLADDNGDLGASQYPVERSGALYNQIAPSKSVVKPVGQFNHSVLIVRGRHCEHWLNGENVVEYETESGPLVGPIFFQNHGTEAWFRNIRIRRL